MQNGVTVRLGLGLGSNSGTELGLGFNSTALVLSLAYRIPELHPLRSLVTSVPGHFGPSKKTEVTRDRSEQGLKCLNHFGPWDRSVHQTV